MCVCVCVSVWTQVALPASGSAASTRAGSNPAAIINSINGSGMTVVAWQLISPGRGQQGDASKALPPGTTLLRLVAQRY